jgi:tetratricopeptide (TPR) repeat protein
VAAGRETHRAAAPPLIGRDEIARELKRALEQAAEGAGGGVLLRGPPGIGKSQLLRWVVEQARGRGFTVLQGRAQAEELPPPFSLLRDLFRSSPPEDGGDADAPRSNGAIPLFLAPFASDRRPAAAEPSAEEPEAPPAATEAGAALLEGPLESAAASRDELFARITEYLLELARRRPVLIAIDDLPYADDSSLDLGRRLAPDLAAAPIALIATAVPDADLPPRTREAVQRFAVQPTVRSLTLRPMTVPEVGELVQWVQGGEAPDRADVLRWHAQTEGNPLFVEQLVRTSTGQRAGPGRDDEPRRDFGEVLIARTRALGENERRLLDYAALIGREFDFPRLVAVAGSGEERVTEGLDRLVQDGLVREKGGEVYEFVTEALRLKIYGELTETRRRLLHRKAGRALEAIGGASDSELARQFYLGRDDLKAVEYNDRAAQQAVRAFAYETSVAHLARAVEAERRVDPTDPKVELRLLNQQGRLLEELGNLPRAEEILLEAVEFARSRVGLDLDLGRALLGLAQTRTDRAEYASARLLAGEASEILERVGTSRDRMDAHRTLGTIAWRVGNFPEAERHRRQALAIAETDGTALEQGQALIDLANTMIPLGSEPFDTALALYTRAADLFATIEYHAAQARVLMNRAVLEYGADRYDEAFADIQRAIAAAERSRSPIWIGYCHLNLAQWNAELGRPGPARAALDRAIQVVTPLGDKLAAQQVAMTKGMVAEAEKAYDVAEAHYQDALAQARTLGMPVEGSEMLYRLAHLAHAHGDPAAARTRLNEAFAAGLREHRPDLMVRAAELETALGAAHPPP